MDCDDYQRAALRTARDKDAPDEFMHLVLGLVGEAGEIAEKVKELVRDKNSDLAQLDLAQQNVDKLADRQRRAVIGGTGPSPSPRRTSTWTPSPTRTRRS